jgi:hypothetical protein
MVARCVILFENGQTFVEAISLHVTKTVLYTFCLLFRLLGLMAVTIMQKLEQIIQKEVSCKIT